jgi:hypothetical protein
MVCIDLQFEGIKHPQAQNLLLVLRHVREGGKGIRWHRRLMRSRPGSCKKGVSARG